MINSKSISPAQRRSLSELTSGFRGIVAFLFLISGLINILALTGSLYMMQIYDRALTSGSIPTLVLLSVLAIGLYLFQGTFDVIRSQVLVRVGSRLDKKIAPLAHRVAIDMPRFGFSTSEALERGRDVDTVRGFLGSQGPAALFDPRFQKLGIHPGGGENLRIDEDDIGHGQEGRDAGQNLAPHGGAVRRQVEQSFKHARPL